MTITELIKRLQYHLDHGVNPDAIVYAWDPDEEKYKPITGFGLDEDTVDIYTDED